MKKKEKNIALIPAAGVGSRMKRDIPKQFICVNDKPLIVYTLEVFEGNENIDEIVVVTLGSKIDYLKDLCKKYNISKVKDNIIVGGKTNGESIYNGINYIYKYNSGIDCNVIINDSVRCLITNDLINEIIDCVKKYGSAVTVTTTEELYISDGQESIGFIPRENLFKIQAPYSYNVNSLMSMYKEAKRRKMDYKNMAPHILMQSLDRSSHLVLGPNFNFKITRPEDLEMFKLIKERGIF